MLKQKINLVEFLLCLFLSSFVSSCELPNEQNGATSSQGERPGTNPDELIEQIVEGLQAVSTDFEELSRPGQVQAWVDKLVVKAQPGIDMPQIATMREGEMAAYLRQRTVAKTEFELRGQRFMEPWILIRMQDGTLGWVHEGGVKYVTPQYIDWMVGQQTRPDTRTRSMNLPQSPAIDRVVIPGQRVGAIRVNNSEEELIGLYGRSNVSQGEVDKPGAGSLPCTIVFPGTDDELRVTWKDASAREGVAAVYIMQQAATWFTPQGLRMGLDLAGLAKVNQAPLDFYGLGWTYAGTVQDWHGGELNQYSQYFYVMLAPPRRVPREALRPFSGDKVISSNAKGVEALNLKVDRWVVYLD
jgi:hypothetical protein